MLFTNLSSMTRRCTTFAVLALALAAPAAAETYVPPQAHREVELHDGATMIYDQNVPITVRDGSIVHANVFRPKIPGRYPVIMGASPYGKDISMKESFGYGWAKLREVPDLCEKSSCEFIRWEQVDPERWVADGYVVIQLEVRGSGYSRGVLDPFSAQETHDYYDAIEWAGQQSWSNGKVGLLGISYLGINQWQVAALRPPHLAAIIPWEAANDFYRDVYFHGGIRSNGFTERWYERQLIPNQNGNPDTNYRDIGTGKPPTGEPLPEALLAQNRIDPIETGRQFPLDGAYYEEKDAKLERIEVPLLSAGNLSAPGLHGRGNYRGYLRAGSEQKWLSVHGGTHVGAFYGKAGMELQKRFFDHFLKGIDNGWEKTPPVTMDIRDGALSEPSGQRTAEAWPLPGTHWSKLYLDARSGSMSKGASRRAAQTDFEARTGSTQFVMRIDRTVDITGPLAARLWVSSSTDEADLFVTAQLFDENGREVTFEGASDPASPLAQGWLRASRRKLDPGSSTPYWPVHAHDEVQKLTPGEFYPVDVALWPTSVIAHAGYRLVLTIAGKDFQRPSNDPQAGAVNRGSGTFLHDDEVDRGSSAFGGTTTIATGPEKESWLLIPEAPLPQE